MPSGTSPARRIVANRGARPCYAPVFFSSAVCERRALVLLIVMLVDLNDFATLDILMFINGVNGSIGAAQTNRALALTLAFLRFIVIARNFTCCHQTAMSDVINPRLQLNRNV